MFENFLIYYLIFNTLFYIVYVIKLNQNKMKKNSKFRWLDTVILLFLDIFVFTAFIYMIIG